MITMITMMIMIVILINVIMSDTNPSIYTMREHLSIKIKICATNFCSNILETIMMMIKLCMSMIIGHEIN